MYPTEQDFFNYALYHLVYHWAVFGATLVLLITIGMVAPQALWFNRLAILATALAGLFFLLRMRTFGAIVNTYLNGAADRARWMPGSSNLAIGAMVVVVFAVAAWKVLPSPATLPQGWSALYHLEGRLGQLLFAALIVVGAASTLWLAFSPEPKPNIAVTPRASIVPSTPAGPLSQVNPPANKALEPSAR